MPKRILSGVQPSGKLHLGNYFGAIRQHIALQDQGEVVQRDVLRPLPQRGRILDGRQGVVVGDEVEAVGLVLQGDVLADGAEVVTQVQLARRLDAAEDALAAGSGIGHARGPLCCLFGLYTGQL